MSTWKARNHSWIHIWLFVPLFMEYYSKHMLIWYVALLHCSGVRWSRVTCFCNESLNYNINLLFSSFFVLFVISCYSFDLFHVLFFELIFIVKPVLNEPNISLSNTQHSQAFAQPSSAQGGQMY